MYNNKLKTDKMKKIGIIGSGIVAQTLGGGFLKHGYQVMLGTRDKSKLAEWQKGGSEVAVPICKRGARSARTRRRRVSGRGRAARGAGPERRRNPARAQGHLDKGKGAIRSDSRRGRRLPLAHRPRRTTQSGRSRRRRTTPAICRGCSIWSWRARTARERRYSWPTHGRPRRSL